MRTFLLFVIFASLPFALLACSCDLEEINEETFERYSFIAHVRVDKLTELNGPVEPNAYYRFSESRLVSFKVLELYRGELASFAIETDYNSSCGLGIYEGEEWLVYAISDRAGSIRIFSCTPTDQYRSTDGIKELSYGYPTRLKRWLDNHCGVSPTSVTMKGISEYVNHYTDGQLEEQTEHKDGLRHGNSVHYYPNGVLMDERHYYEGEPTGLRRYYLDDGSLDFELEYNFRGELVRETNHHEGYDNLRHEIIYTPERDLEKDFGFRADGTLARMTTRRDWSPLTDKYFDASGNLIHHLAYYEDWVATVLKDSLAVER